MSLTPLFSAHPVIQIHAFAAFAAFLLGALVLFGRKGDATHRRLGRVWVYLMVLTGVSSFFIWELRMWGPFSPIHLLSIGTLYLLYRAVGFARMRRILAHQRTMQGLYIGALAISGFLTFAPGRIMYDVAFGPDGASAGEIVVFLATVGAALGSAVVISRYRPVRSHSARRARRT